MFSQLTQEPRAKTFFRDKTWSPVQAGRSRCIHHRKHRYQSHLKTRDTPGLSAFPSQMIRDGERTEFIGDLQRVIFCVTGEGPTCTNDGSSAGSYEGSYLPGSCETFSAQLIGKARKDERSLEKRWGWVIILRMILAFMSSKPIFVRSRIQCCGRPVFVDMCILVNTKIHCALPLACLKST